MRCTRRVIVALLLAVLTLYIWLGWMKQPVSRDNFVDLSKDDKMYKGKVIMTIYFTSQNDPVYSGSNKKHGSHSRRVKNNDINYINKWYDSMRSVCERSDDLDGIIFHDGSCNEEFVQKWGRKGIHFVEVDISRSTHSLNDTRFFLFRDFLKKHPEIKSAFMTDGNDVKVVQSPFPHINDDKLYIGSETASISSDGRLRRLPLNHWIGRTIKKDDAEMMLEKSKDNKLLNAGILGGNRDLVLQFLGRITEFIGKYSTGNTTPSDWNEPVVNRNVNMAGFNLVAIKYFNDKIVYGAPIHSVFHKKQNDRKDVWFVHK